MKTILFVVLLIVAGGYFYAGGGRPWIESYLNPGGLPETTKVQQATFIGTPRVNPYAP